MQAKEKGLNNLETPENKIPYMSNMCSVVMV